MLHATCFPICSQCARRLHRNPRQLSHQLIGQRRSSISFVDSSPRLCSAARSCSAYLLSLASIFPGSRASLCRLRSASHPSASFVPLRSLLPCFFACPASIAFVFSFSRLFIVLLIPPACLPRDLLPPLPVLSGFLFSPAVCFPYALFLFFLFLALSLFLFRKLNSHMRGFGNDLSRPLQLPFLGAFPGAFVLLASSSSLIHGSSRPPTFDFSFCFWFALFSPALRALSSRFHFQVFLVLMFSAYV